MFISTGTMADDSTPSIQKHIMDSNPDIKELTDHVTTAKWKDLGIQLDIKGRILAECNTCTEMYLKWLAIKPKRETTRRNLIAALKKIDEIRLADDYMEHLGTMVS